jgi:serine/threonine protein kinase
VVWVHHEHVLRYSRVHGAGGGSLPEDVRPRTNTLPPQILLEQRYGRAVDWWAFGVLMYEMLLGQSPFRGDDEDEIFDAILEDEPLYPINMSRDAVAILQKVRREVPSISIIVHRMRFP